MTDLAISQYLGIFSITIIKSKYHFLLALSLGVTIIMSVLIVACNNVIAQTLETITKQRKVFENNPQIPLVEHNPQVLRPSLYGIISMNDIAVNPITNKIYVAMGVGSTVSVFDSNSGSATKNIPVRGFPVFIAVDILQNKIYVANSESNTVSVINGNNDTEITEIPVGISPVDIVITYGNTHNIHGNKIYVANSDSSNVSVIDASNYKKKLPDIAVGKSPTRMAEGFNGRIYVANSDSNTVSVIDQTTNTVIKNITVGKLPSDLASSNNKIYVANLYSNTVSVLLYRKLLNMHCPNSLAIFSCF